MDRNVTNAHPVWVKSAMALLLTVLMLLTLGCAGAPKSEPAAHDMDATGSSNSMAMESPAEYALYGDSAEAELAIEPSSEAAQGEQGASDSAVRKIVYNADMSVTADAPEQALDMLVQKTQSLGGYLSASYTTTDEYGAYRCTATLRVPADRLEELVSAAKDAGKVDDYRLTSDDISFSYYDTQARLDSAKSEEAQLLEIMKRCETVEEILSVRESLKSVRADIESYTTQMNLWDLLVSYATLELTVNRTPRTPVENENELISIWKASDVWNRMSRGFQNSARFVVNAIGAVGIFLAVALIPGAVLFLCIGLPIILHKKKKRKKKLESEEQARVASERAETALSEAAEQTEPKKE